jgi:phosphoglycerate dehydrogenase-like enzyme
MRTVILENVGMNEEQKQRIRNLGPAAFFDRSSDEEAKERVRGADIVVVDWVAPSPFLLDMKSPSLVALMSTGYAWIKSRQEARAKGILISNVPGYATEAVAEHVVGLMLAIARWTVIGDKTIRSGEKDQPVPQGTELRDKCLGIVGLGSIGYRVSELARAFGMKVVTYNRHSKKCDNIADLSLEDLMRTCDVVCVTCPLNDQSKGMLDKKYLSHLKPGAMLVGATWGVVSLDDLIPLLRERHIRGFGFDVALEAGSPPPPQELLQRDNVVLTPHVGYNTLEAKLRQIDICISNIEAFAEGKPKNIVN